MRLFIQIKAGQPHEHPILEDNFRQAFPEIDVENLPPQFAEFVKTPRPIIPAHYTLDPELPEYVWDGNLITEHWSFRPMTEQELLENEVYKPIGVTRV